MTRKPNYGIDAPGVIHNFFVASSVCLVIAFGVRSVTIGNFHLGFYPGFVYSAAWFALPATLMLIYSLVGKFRHRDRILAKVPWAGTETVLDVGTGRGLLLIGAAKHLTTGHATGIDIWNAEDLSGNAPAALLANISLEGVTDKTTVKSEDARQMSFPDGSFDVVVSNLCLHNIYERSGRSKACHEIARVLKSGGLTVISDYKLMAEYTAEFRACGMTVEMFPRDWFGTFPPLGILVARKP
jgi:SAM-dependent methyltransferase